MSKLKYAALFLVFIMVCLTPAFATQMSEKAQTSEDSYDKAQKLTRHQVFEKIKLQFELFGLLCQVENTPRDNPGVYSESSDAVYNKALLSQDNADLLLNYRNAPVKSYSDDVVDNKTKESGSTNNTTNNTTAVAGDSKSSETNTMNNNQINDVTYYKDAVTPEAASADAKLLIAYFSSRGIALSKVSQKEVDESLIGNVVQLVDKKANLRYVYVKNVRNNTVTFVSNNGKSISMSAETFAEWYTGILLVNDGGVSPESLINSINKMQKEKIDADTQDAQNTKNSAYIYAGIGGAFLVVGFLVFIIGLIITGLTANAVSSMSKDNSKSSITGIIKDPSRGGQFYKFRENQEALVGHFQGTKLEERNLMLQKIRGVTRQTFYIDDDDIEILESCGVTLTSINAWNAFLQALNSNWIMVVLMAIGIILIIAGIACLCATIVLGILAVINGVTGAIALSALDQKRKDREEWLNMVNETNSTNATNATNATFSSALSNGTG